ncbi:regulatory particle non-ATPase 12 [Calliopsis andreniformis]|uniref:regulatory particle non-ATPase 12 n=1 Tax=Calliopsis andreniformis TaxID=337506 RepID=UPI003FCE3E26
MAALANVCTHLGDLKKEWANEPIDLKKCGEILKELKKSLVSMRFLPTSNGTLSKKELFVARQVLEYGAQWSILVEDIPSFERYMAQLKCYYFDYKAELMESAYKYHLLGLNLLLLLSQNRVAEFHTELELLPSDQIQSNVYIRHPLSLEQYLMEGSYNKIFLAKDNVPDASYNFFTDILLNTVRDEIGTCMESAYDKISIQDAARMLNLTSEEDMKAFAAKKNWTLAKDGYFYFSTASEKKTEATNRSQPSRPIPSADLATLAIDYARELEMIV